MSIILLSFFDITKMFLILKYLNHFSKKLHLFSLKKKALVFKSIFPWGFHRTSNLIPNLQEG